MEAAKSDIIKDVKVLLDEQRDNTALITDGDEISMETDEIIWSYITQAVDEVHLQAQSWMVGDITTASSVTLSEKRKGRKGTLPDDFLRMIKFIAEDLQTDVYEPINEDSDDYIMQQSKWAGVRGNAQRPVVAIVPSNESGKMDVEVYGTAKSSATLVYIKRCTVSAENKVTIASRCYRSLLYTLAKHYLMTLGDAEKATLFGMTGGGLIGASEPVADQTQQN